MIPRCLALLLATLAVSAAWADDPDDVPPPPPAPQEGVEVMARGPVHEAFAEPTAVRPEPSPLVTKQPPDPIQELPPDQRPEGDNVRWIPGYWAFDQDRNDFLWVSGFWRALPPGRQWIPGTWQPVEGGFHWVAGFWAAPGQDQLQFLPAPPPSIDEGPAVAAPQPNSVYVPGCWVYRDTRYMWRPGFWSAFRPNWVWIPAHYIWTPGGYLFIEGYWDRPLAARGLLFAPVRLAARVLVARRWFFTPTYAIQSDFLLSALFVRPAYSHYYFGDYFANQYTTAGFVPWINYRIGRAYDPNFNYYRVGFAGYGNWEQGLRNLYRGRFNGTIPRPPQTLVQQTQVIQNITSNNTVNNVVNRTVNITNVQNVSVLAPITQIQTARQTNLLALANVREGAAKRPPLAAPALKLQPVTQEHRALEQKAATQLQGVAQQRRDVHDRVLRDGSVPVHVTDKPKQTEFKLPAHPHATPTPTPTRPTGTPRTVTPPPAHAAPPPTPTIPKHEERPIPRHEPIKPPMPPKQMTPQPKPTPPPKKEAAPAKPSQPPKKEEKKK